MGREMGDAIFWLEIAKGFGMVFAGVFSFYAAVTGMFDDDEPIKPIYGSRKMEKVRYVEH